MNSDKHKTIQILEALAADPRTTVYTQDEVRQALLFAAGALKDVSAKGTKWTDQEDQQLKDHFASGLKTAELAKIHNRSSGAIRSRLIKLGIVKQQ